MAATAQAARAATEETTVETTVWTARSPVLLTAAAVLAIAALVVVAVGQGDRPPVIHLGAGGADAWVAPMAERADEDVDVWAAAAVEYRFVLTEGARFDAGEATAWRFEPPADVRGSAATLAARLGGDRRPRTRPALGRVGRYGWRRRHRPYLAARPDGGLVVHRARGGTS